MFCPNCGNNLPENAAFCGKCGSSIGGDQPKQNMQYVATASTTKKIGALIMIAVLLIFTILPAILWFCDVFTVSVFGMTKNFTWSEIYEYGDDETIMEVFRWVGIGFLTLNALIAGLVIATGKYNVKRTRFITSRFVSLVNVICHIILVIVALDSNSAAEFTFGNVMFIISCVVLFVLPFFISHATKQKAPAVQQF